MDCARSVSNWATLGAKSNLDFKASKPLSMSDKRVAFISFYYKWISSNLASYFYINLSSEYLNSRSLA